MADEPTPPVEPTPPPSEAEWTDDIDSSDLETPASESPEEVDLPEEDWDEDALDWADEPIPPLSAEAASPSMREALAWLRPVWRRGRSLWRQLLAGLRSRIPATAQLSDSVLSALVIGVLVLLLMILNSVQHPATATAPPPAAPVAPPTEPAPSDPVAPPAPPEPAPDLPPAAVAPEVSPVPPAEPPELDPADRDRIAQIQTQLTDGTLSYGQGLVESVQADFKDNRLTITVGSGWYRLSAYEQGEFANGLGARAQQMDFADLQVRSLEGDLLARSPVVGNEMVILQRQKPPEVEPPPRPRYRIMVDR